MRTAIARGAPALKIPQGSVLAPVAASMVLEAAARGLPPGPLLDRLGLDASSARDPERRVPFGALFSVWAECMRELRDPGLPIAAAQRIRLEDYTVLGFATTAAPTFRAALGIVARYSSVVADGCRFTVVDDPAHAGIRLGWEREGERSLGHRVANECAIAEALHVAQTLAWSGQVATAKAIHIWRLSEPTPGITHLDVTESMSGFMLTAFFSQSELEADMAESLAALKTACEPRR